jgi:spore coat protein U-like protein
MKRILAAATALLGVMVGQNAWAASATSTIAATANVGMACTMSSTRLAFHSIVTTTVGTGAATITVNCTAGALYDVGLDYGANATGTQRRLVGVTPTNLVTYNVFTDAGYSIPWGNIPGVDTEAGTGSGANQILTVYAQVPSQTVVSDIYTDLITVTITY